MDEAALREYAERTNAIVERLLKDSPAIHPITAHVMAQDIMSVDDANEAVKQGVDPVEASALIGSFARWDWLVTMLSQGAISEEWFVKNACSEWRAADPDDTNPAYLALWQRLYRRNRGMLRDGRRLPTLGRSRHIAIFRGGPPTDALLNGFAWTTDPKIARKFANGAGARIQTKGGVVITGHVLPSKVLAYITGRNESEVIVDPRLVMGIKPVKADQ